VQGVFTTGRSKPLVQKRGAGGWWLAREGMATVEGWGPSSPLPRTSLQVWELGGCEGSSRDLLASAVYKFANRDFYVTSFYLSFTQCLVLVTEKAHTVQNTSLCEAHGWPGDTGAAQEERASRGCCSCSRSHPCYGYGEKSSHPLEQNYLFNQLPLSEPLFCPGISSFLMLLKCKLFGAETEAICFWLSVSGFMAAHALISLTLAWGIEGKRELDEDRGFSLLWVFFSPWSDSRANPGLSQVWPA